jgi:hypothetical protein
MTFVRVVWGLCREVICAEACLRDVWPALIKYVSGVWLGQREREKERDTHARTHTRTYESTYVRTLVA